MPSSALNEHAVLKCNKTAKFEEKKTKFEAVLNVAILPVA